MKIKIRTKLIVAFFLITGILLFTGLVSYVSLDRVSKGLGEFDTIHKKQEIYDRVRFLIHNSLRGPMSWGNTMSPRERLIFRKDSEAISLAFKELEEGISKEEEWAAYRSFRKEYDELYKECLRLFTMEDPLDVRLVMKSIKEKTENVIKSGDRLREIFSEDMRRQISISQKTRNWAYILILVKSLAGVILALLLGFFLSRSISKPLEMLKEKAELIGKEKAYKPIEIKTVDEIEGLSEEFNRMAFRLERTLTDLKEKVSELNETRRGLQETKDYLEGLIENSADAIITSDLEGRISSWNKGAEDIYGFREEEVLGKALPMVPEFLMAEEMGFIEKIKSGETIKNIETLRQRKDGSLFEISLTLSPILDPEDNIIGISGISRDLTEKKMMGKELLRRTEELSTIYFIGDAMRTTLNLERLLRIILTSVTMGEGLGFNRAILFLIDENKKTLKGIMGVGPGSPEEAWQIWGRLSSEGKTLKDLITGDMPWDENSFVDRLARDIEVPLDREGILTLTVRGKRGFNIPDAKIDLFVEPFLIKQFETEAFATVPLIAKDKVIGVILVDNLFTKRQITEEDMRFLTMFANEAASAIENAQLFEKITDREAELRNIFDSITDMVFFSDTDFVIKKVNKTVLDKFKETPENLIGKRCYEVFPCSGPRPGCPHIETLNTKKTAYQEIEDQTLEGSFIVSTSPFLDYSGNVMGTVHIVRDITEEKRLREKLLHSEKMAAIGEMAAKIAHEIRNPLASIGGFAQRLERRLEKLGSKEDYTKIIISEVKRLERTLQELTGFIKETPLQVQTVRVNHLIEDILTLLSSELDERGIRVIKRLHPKEIKIFADPDQLRQAFLNIINNAQQAIRRNGDVLINTSLSGDVATIEIGDTGGGIPEDMIDNIFSPFFTTKTSGIGLGLAITHRIIERHGGEIEVINRKGIGASFIIKLPFSFK